MKPPKSWLTKSLIDETNEAKYKSGKNTNNFGSTTDDTFRKYMVQKIHQQRRQFGLVLPPPDPALKTTAIALQATKPHIDISPKNSCHAEETDAVVSRRKKLISCRNSVNTLGSSTDQLVEAKTPTKNKTVRFNPDVSSSMQGLVNRLKRKHGQNNGCKTRQLNLSKQKIKDRHRKSEVEMTRNKEVVRRGRTSPENGMSAPLQTTLEKSQTQEDHHTNDVIYHRTNNIQDKIDTQIEFDHDEPQKQKPKPLQSPHPNHLIKRQRPDLFFFGVTVLVNGYTEPSADTIMRTLHKHGGDVEKYETSRITHIIAQNLSSAKASIYKKQKRPIPVIRPQWIVDCIEARQLLPYGNYLLDEVKDKFYLYGKTMDSFIQQESCRKHIQRQYLQQQTTNPSITATDHTHLNRTANKNMRGEKVPPLVETIDDNDGSSAMDCVDYLSEVEIQRRNRSIEKTSTTYLSEFQPNLPDQPSGKESSHMKNNRNVEVQECKKGQKENEFNPVNSSGGIRTVGTDPNFLESYFKSSRLSYIGSFKQRLKKKSIACKAKSSQNCELEKKKNLRKKYIFHVDMDCFFAAVAIRKYPQYRNQPVAVGHAWKNDSKGVRTSTDTQNHSRLPNKKSSSELSTCNYIARKYGIKKGMFLGNARKLCPDLIVLPYDYDGYEEVACAVGDILHRYAELHDGAVEQVSCDESYIEIHLNDGDIILDSPGNNTKGNISHCDLLNAIGDGIRKDIFESTNCTASVGIGINKLIAKLATDSVKPNGLCFFKDNKECLMNLKLRDLPGIGHQMEKKLIPYNLTYVRDIWDMGEEAELELCKVLGPGVGKKIYKYCYGEDHRHVRPVPRKTIGVECNYGVRFNGPYGVDHMISGLAKEVARRMEDVGVVGSCITLKIKERKKGSGPPGKFNGMGSCNDHSKSCNLQNKNPGSRDSSLISRVGMQLFNELKIDKNEVRGMGIVISKLKSTDSIQPEEECMYSWLRPGEENLNANHKYSENSQVSSILLEKSDTPDLVAREEIVADHHFGNLSDGIEHQTVRQSPNAIEVEKEAELQVDGNCSRQDGNIHALKSEKRQYENVTNLSPHNHDSLNDIALPSYSQIDMDEVNSLPKIFRVEIMKTLGKACMIDDDHMIAASNPKSPSGSVSTRFGTDITNFDENLNTNESKSSSSFNRNKTNESQAKKMKKIGRKVKSFQQKDNNFQQPDVKQMLKLASIKSGNDKLEYNGERVSLTQLDYLPLNVQLQVANNDMISLKGNDTLCNSTLQSPPQQIMHLSQSDDNIVKSIIDISDSPNLESSKLCGPSKITMTHEMIVDEAISQGYDDDTDPCNQDMVPHQSDCIVIRNWLDSLPNPSTNDVAKFQEYLYISISGKRLDDVVKFLHIIKRRKDIWGKNYDLFIQNTDNYLFSIEGRRLDLCWLGLK